MCSKATQDEGRLQFAKVSPTLFCDLHGPKRKELRDVLKSITCNFHCHGKIASALAQEKSSAGACAVGTAGARGELQGLGTIILQSLDIHRHLHIYLHLYRHCVFFWLLAEFISETRDTGPKHYFLRKYKYLKNDISWSISVDPSTIWRRLTWFRTKSNTGT